MGRHTVEEPAVVGDDDGAACEVGQRVLDCPERVDVEVVGRLVEQQQVPAGAQGFARWTRLRSPPERSPARFCWSLPLKLNHETYWRG